MMAYMGKYTLDDDKCDFYIDRAWNPDWMGLTLQRQIAFEGVNLKYKDRIKLMGVLSFFYHNRYS